MSGLFHDLNHHGDKVAVIDEKGTEISYADFLKRADALGGTLKERSLVLIVCKNGLDCLAGYIGVMRSKSAALLIHHSIKPDQLADIQARFNPSYVYAPDAFGQYHLKETGSAAPLLHPDLALLLPTSGTTGSRNFVRLSAHNLHTNAQSIVQYLSITDTDRAITTMPMNYTYGLSIIHSHLAAGASLILSEESLVSPKFWEAIRDFKATTFGGVPFIYEMLKKLRFAKMDLSHLRYLTQAGGKLSKELSVEFAEIAEQKNFQFITMYGQTEATSRIAYLPSEQARTKAGSIGKAIPGVTLSLIDESGAVIEQNNVAGELVCRGDNVSMGYAIGSADLAKVDENKGILYTGDIALRDEDGFYFIVGRKKRFLKIFGHRVNLDEIEQLLKNIGYDCACGGTDDHLKIFIAGKADIVSVKADMTRLTTINPQGFTVIPVPAIPRSESGKIDYARLNEGMTA